MSRRILLVSTLLVPFSAFAQSVVPDDPARLVQDREVVKGPSTSVAAAVNLGITVSKTAYVDGQNICGTIRITNNSRSPVSVDEWQDTLEVHFPRGVTPPALPVGSTPNWFTVAFVPVALGGAIAAGETVAVDYCFPLCLAAEFTAANSMRNVIRIDFLTEAGRFIVVTTRSASFEPPILDCQACCLPDGSCTETLPVDCAAESGLTQGFGTDCETTECTQACCLPNSLCSDRTLSDCRAESGEPLGLGTTCATASCVGACCSSDGCNDNLSRDDCVAAAGTYLGSGTSCASEVAACPTGACCHNGVCKDFVPPYGYWSQARCELEAGEYLGDGTTCATVTTTCRGACCLEGSCYDDFFPGICFEGYLGNDTTCESEFSACPTGACCHNGACKDFALLGYHLGQGECEISNGGTYLGDGTTCATANTTCRGACCLEGRCYDDYFPGICLEGYLGNDTTCTATSCTEACCFSVGCEDLLPSECAARGGDPRGPGTECSDFQVCSDNAP